ncbi:MAG: hypothetical protein MUF38_12620, partial [Anaerolineae bacterium]|nr:hypothetical protein [Anaerolineae bacterium]
MRLSMVVVIAAALVAALAVVLGGNFVLNPERPLLGEAGFDSPTLTPNADGQLDVVRFSFSLSRTADVTIRLTNADGMVFAFRENMPTAPGDYSLQFSGVVDGFTLPGEDIQGTIERRLIPDGEYRWELTAVGVDRDEQAALDGVLTVADGDNELPLLNNFTLSPSTFTPNQDGIDDRVALNAYLTKTVPTVRAYLIDDSGQR